MPPQQGDGLLDFVDCSFRLGAHLYCPSGPSIWSEGALL
jgi:hypothetical protein